MRPYNVEFFNRDFTFRDHNTISRDDVKFEVDYLDPENNKVKIMPPCDGDVNDYIRLTGDGAEVWGIVLKKDISKVDSSGMIEYTYKDFEDLMDVDIVVDTDQLGEGTLEDFIADTIDALYISNSDTLQNIPGLRCEVLTQTTDWELDLTSDDEDDHYCKAKLLDDIILPAFKKDFVRVLFLFDMAQRSITAQISVNHDDLRTIETSLPNVVSSSIKYRTIKKEINKDIICNKKHYETTVTYYLHTDGTHDTIDTDRISPVVRKLETVSTKTASEWEDKWEKDLNSAANTISSAQSSIEKGEELDEDKLEKVLEAVETINKIPGVTLRVDEETGQIIDLERHSIEKREILNADGSKTVIIEDTYDDSMNSYQEVINPDGSVTVELTDIYSGSEAYSKETVQEIIDVFITTEKYVKQCAQFAWDEFMEKAQEKADKTFNSNKYENNIEVKCAVDDSLIRPYDMQIGQIVNVLDESGNSYQTILSGYKQEKGMVTLIFGTERIELTKILKGRS